MLTNGKSRKIKIFLLIGFAEMNKKTIIKATKTDLCSRKYIYMNIKLQKKEDCNWGSQNIRQ